MENFIDEYVAYASKLSASPKKFHQMMAYSLLSQVIGRRPIYQHNGPPIGPNFWMLVLAPSSTMAKSSALSIGRRILNKAYLDDKSLHLFPQGGSSENFFERLRDNPSGILFSSEFCNLVNWFRLSYATDIPGLLIDAYDQPSTIYKSIGTSHKGNKKEYLIHHPFINAYAVSSYELFNSVINQTLLTGGFLVRWLLIREDSEDNYRAFTHPIDEILENEMGEKLREIMRLEEIEGIYDYDERGKKLYEEWFYGYLKKIMKESGHFFIPPYCQRRVADLHKLAMIHSILRKGNHVMNFEDTDAAITIAQQSIVDAIYLIENKISVSKEEKEWNRTLEYIHALSNGEFNAAPHWKVMKYSKLPAFQFKRHIETLLEMKKIERLEVKGMGVFYKVFE